MFFFGGMKRAYRQGLCFILLLLPFSSALQLSEVMPDCGNRSANCEFIELYSAEAVDLSGYILDTSGQRQRFALNGSFQGFLVITNNKAAFRAKFSLEAIEWRGMGLANDGDVVKILKDNETVDSFSYTSSKKNISWQKLNGWKECAPTPSQGNACEEVQHAQEKAPVAQPTPAQNSGSLQSSQSINTSGSESINTAEEIEEDQNISQEKEALVSPRAQKPQESQEEVSEEMESKVIYLGKKEKDIKIYESMNEKVKAYAIYGFALFCVLLVILLMMKRSGGVV